uniref:Uncharacterized protein n=1 Tax=Lepeophtheirus salmonis TaxID=72036 RepID=A0A0K2T4T8_LEPSM
MILTLLLLHRTKN